MTMSPKDLRVLAAPIAALTLALLAGAGALVYGLGQARQGERQLQAARQARIQAEGRVRQVHAEASELQDKGQRYRQLLARGVVGAEARLAWIERLRFIEQQHKLFRLDYELSPIQKLRDAPSGAINASNMTVSLPLLHEGDLLALLDALRATENALVLPTECAVERAAAGTRPPTAGPAPGLRAECRLAWVTIEPETP